MKAGIVSCIRSSWTPPLRRDSGQVPKWSPTLKYLALSACFMMVLVGCAASEVKKPEVERVEPVRVEMKTAPSVVKVLSISTETLAGKIRITIEGDSEFTYTPFKLRDPLRLVIDLPTTDTTQVSEITFTDKFPLLRITPFLFTERDTVNSRIEIALSRLVPYQVFSDANKLFIDLEMPAEEVVAVPPPTLLLPPGFEELIPAQKKPPIVIESKPEEVSPEISKPSPFPPEVPMIEIAKPPEKAREVAPPPKILTAPSAISVIKAFEVSKVDRKTRITLYADKTPEFDVRRSESPPRITMDLKQSDLSGAEKVITPDNLKTLVKRVHIFQLRRTPDGTDNVVRVLVDLMKLTKHEVIIEPEKLILDIEHPVVLTKVGPIGGEEIVEVPLLIGLEAALQKEKEAAKTEIVPTLIVHTSKTGEQLISLRVQHADLLEVLELFAEVSGLNLVVHPGVSGTVTVRLENIPWDQALDTILKANNLRFAIEGNVLRIAPASVFQQESTQRVEQQRQQLEARRIQAGSAPLKTKLISVNFADPSTIANTIQQFLGGASHGNHR